MTDRIQELENLLAHLQTNHKKSKAAREWADEIEGKIRVLRWKAAGNNFKAKAPYGYHHD